MQAASEAEPVEPTASEPQPLRYAGRLLALSMFVMGACGLAYEYTLGALGNHLLGSGHEQIFVVIGVMMFAMGVGSGLSRHVEGQLIDKWLFLELMLGVAGGLSVLVIYAAFALTPSHQVFLYAFAVFIGGAIGMEIPLLIRINTEYSRSLRTNLSEVLFMDYAGALAGALLFAYVLMTRFTLMQIAASLGLVNVALAGIGTIYFWPLVRWRKRLPIALGISTASLVALLFAAEPLVAKLEQRTFADAIIHRETTRYQHLVLTQRGDRLCLFINGQLQFNSTDEEIYHELLTHVPMALAEQRKSVLILGGGDGLALREVLDWPEVERVTLVDLDRRVMELAAQVPAWVELNEGAFLDARVRTSAGPGNDGSGEGESLVVERAAVAPHLFRKPVVELAEVEVLPVDADLFLREAGEAYDVILVDFPDPHSFEVAKLYSREFYTTLSQRLAPGGFLAIQSGSPYHAAEVFACVGVTLGAAGFSVLPYHQNVPSFGEWGWHLAWNGGAEPQEVLERLVAVELPVKTGFLNAGVLRGAFAFGQGRLDSSGIEASSKMRPRILEYARRAWSDV